MQAEDVVFGTVHGRRGLRQLRAHPVRDLAPLRPGRGVVGLGKGRGDDGPDDPTAALAGMGRGIALEMHPTALPRGGAHARRGGLDALVCVADHELHARQAAAHEITQEVRPEG